MKLLQLLLVAPAALGLLAPVAQAADRNIAGVSDSASEEQVTSVTQFSEVYPTDWAKSLQKKRPEWPRFSHPRADRALFGLVFSDSAGRSNRFQAFCPAGAL